MHRGQAQALPLSYTPVLNYTSFTYIVWCKDTSFQCWEKAASCSREAAFPIKPHIQFFAGTRCDPHPRGGGAFNLGQANSPCWLRIVTYSHCHQSTGVKTEICPFCTKTHRLCPRRAGTNGFVGNTF